MPINFIHSDTHETETTESWFSNRFLTARINSGQLPNEGFDPVLENQRTPEWKAANWKEIKANDLKYDEDVNPYITLSLAELVNPRKNGYIDYLVDTASDAGRLAINLNNESEIYRVFRINADFMLFHLGLFSPNSNMLEDTCFDKGGSYYNSAAFSLKRARGGRSGLSDVLEKLALRFGKYVEILRYMKNSSSNFFSFHFKFAREEMDEFQKQLTMEARKRG